jgi:peptidoglycan biosynthesis protein MviN/MurJ (putative lipid II flippase)
MLNMILIPKYQSVGAATSSVIAESIIMIFYFIYTKGTLNIKEIVLHLWRYIVASVIMFTILSTIKSIMMSNIVSLICIILISGIVYFVSLLLLRDKLLFSIISTIIVYIKKKRFI